MRVVIWPMLAPMSRVVSPGSTRRAMASRVTRSKTPRCQMRAPICSLGEMRSFAPQGSVTSTNWCWVGRTVRPILMKTCSGRKTYSGFLKALRRFMRDNVERSRERGADEFINFVAESFPIKPLFVFLKRGTAQGFVCGRIVQEILNVIDILRGRSRKSKPLPVGSVAHDGGDATDVGGETGQTVRGGFDKNEAVRFEAGGDDKKMAFAKKIVDEGAAFGIFLGNESVGLDEGGEISGRSAADDIEMDVGTPTME